MSVRFRVLDAGQPGERAEWLEIWSRWPAREVMAHPDYVAAFAGSGERAVLALGEAPDGGLLLPLVLRPLSAEPWAGAGEAGWDATTPYGYGGPFAFGERRGDDPAFWRGYEAFCRGSRIVCTFTRLPLLAGELALPGRVEVRGPNVVVPLAGGAEAVRRGYDRDVRRRLRVAEREGLRAEVDPDGARLEAFHAVYAHTMERRRAEAFYRLPLAFFARLLERLRGHVVFVHALAGERVVSSELALVSARSVYAFLGGTWAESFRAYPNEVVRDATAAWAAREGKETYVLGGGKGGTDDGILRHKALLAPRGLVPFRTASLMHDELAYQALARRRAAAEGAAGRAWAPRPEWFPAYRA